MRTVGEILKRIRVEKNLELEDIEKVLKIRKKYLIAMEENAWEKLPSLPYIKGFLRNYSNHLGLKPEEMVAIFRRQFSLQDRSGLLPKGIVDPLNDSSLKITPQIAVAGVIIGFILLFFGYLFYQYFSFTRPPSLEVKTPLEGEIVKSEAVQVSGKTESDAVIAINNQKIALTPEGEFHTQLDLTPGVNTIVIEAVSKYGKKKTVNRTIQIQTNNE